MDIQFDWNKAESNLKKHGVSFSEASSVLLDSDSLVMEDPTAIYENRWIAIGMSNRVRLITIIYTLRDSNRIRLISARKATRHEGAQYG